MRLISAMEECMMIAANQVVMLRREHLKIHLNIFIIVFFFL